MTREQAFAELRDAIQRAERVFDTAYDSNESYSKVMRRADSIIAASALDFARVTIESTGEGGMRNALVLLAQIAAEARDGCGDHGLGFDLSDGLGSDLSDAA